MKKAVLLLYCSVLFTAFACSDGASGGNEGFDSTENTGTEAGSELETNSDDIVVEMAQFAGTCEGIAVSTDCGTLTNCDGSCVDLATDPRHCGDCNVMCQMAGGQFCEEGSCECGELTDCDGVCVDLTTNPDHCGACDVSAPATPYARKGIADSRE
jgi:hypothetical protein